MNVQSDVALEQRRHTELGRWFQEAYPVLFDLAASIAGIENAERVMESVIDQLPSFTATTQADFDKWIHEAVSQAARIAAQFTALYREHRLLVYSAIHKGLGTLDAATSLYHPEVFEDLAIETWRIVWEKLSGFVPGKAKITTWITQIALFIAFNYKRKELRRMGWIPPSKINDAEDSARDINRVSTQTEGDELYVG